MGLRPDWSDPTELDAFRGLMGCQDDNSYFAAVQGFGVYVGNVQQRFEENCTEAFGRVPLRVQNLTQETADMYNTNPYTWSESPAQAGPQCVIDNMEGKPLNPKLTEFQIFCINNCTDPDVVQSGQWEQMGDAVRASYRELWDKFLELYPPQQQPAPTT